MVGRVVIPDVAFKVSFLSYYIYERNDTMKEMLLTARRYIGPSMNLIIYC